MNDIYNRDLVTIAKGKALIHHSPLVKGGIYRIFCRVVAASACHLHVLVCVALILSLLATSTPAAPQTIVALTKESSESFGLWLHVSGWGRGASRLMKSRDAKSASGKSAIRNPPSAITLTSDPKVELAADRLARNNSVELAEALRPKDDEPLDDSSTSLFASSVWAAKHNTALIPQGNGSVTYSSAGTFTWTAPAGVTSATVETWGGGGGAGGGLAGGASGGGGGGAYSKSTVSVTGGTGYTVVVGSGGVAGNPNDFGAAGGNGGDSIFNTTSVVAKGGTGGECGATGGGGAGGAASAGTGTTKYSGGNGAAHPNPYHDSGGGGSSAGTGANGNNASGHTGGSAPTGGGAGGKGGAWNNNGTDGAVPGSAPGGGGGGDIVLSALGVSGAPGAAGKVVITYSSGNQSPMANAGGPYSGTAGAAVQFNGSGSSDADGTIVSYAWAFGDGGTGSGATPSHTYATAGTKTANLTVTDNGGATNSATATVTISTGGGNTNWINCKQSYGATGDGSTDDTSALNACIAAGAGKVVYVPQGTYLVNSLDSPAADTVVKGDGQGSTILKRKNNANSIFEAPVINLTNGRVTLRDFTIDGNCVVTGPGTCSNQATGSYNELRPEGDDLIIDNLEFKNSQQVSIFNRSSGLKVRNSRFIGFGHATNGPAFGIQTHGEFSGSITVEGSYFTNYRFNAIIINGVGLDPETATLISNNTFVGNHWSTFGGQVDIIGRTILNGNRFYPGTNPQTTATAIECERSDGTIISNNYVTGGGTYKWGIILQDDTHSIVEGNYVKGFSIGMAFTSGTDYIIARNNDFSLNTTPLSNASTGAHNAINSLIAEVSKGADVASAGTITPSGTTFTLTGTTTISTISTANITVGTMIHMITASGLTFDEAGNIDVTGGTILVTNAGYLVFAVWDGTKWRLR